VSMLGSLVTPVVAPLLGSLVIPVVASLLGSLVTPVAASLLGSLVTPVVASLLGSFVTADVLSYAVPVVTADCRRGVAWSTIRDCTSSKLLAAAVCTVNCKCSSLFKPSLAGCLVNYMPISAKLRLSLSSQLFCLPTCCRSVSSRMAAYR
jgi:hypothetical protein